MPYFESAPENVHSVFAEGLDKSRVFPKSGEVVFLAHGIPVPSAAEKLRLRSQEQSGILRGPREWEEPELSDQEQSELFVYALRCLENGVQPLRAVGKLIAAHGNYDQPHIASEYFPAQLPILPSEIREAIDFADVRPLQPHVYVVRFEPSQINNESLGFAKFQRLYPTVWRPADYQAITGSWTYATYPSIGGLSYESTSSFRFGFATPTTFELNIPDGSNLSIADSLYIKSWFGELKAQFEAPVTAGRSA